MTSIPTRYDASPDDLATLNKYFILASGRAHLDFKRSCSASSATFRFVGDLLLSEARLMRNCTDYRLYRRATDDQAGTRPSFLAMLCGRTHRWLHVDPELAAFLGYSEAELAEDWTIALHPETYEETDEQLTRIYRDLLERRIGSAELVVRYQARAGYSVWARVRFAAVDSLGAGRIVMELEDVSMEKWTALLYEDLDAFRTLMRESGYRGAYYFVVDGLLDHYLGINVQASVLEKLEEMLASVV